MLKNGFFWVLLLFSSLIYANENIDSLNQVVESTSGKEKIDALLLLGEQYFATDFNTSLKYSKEALHLSNKIEYKLGTAIAHNNIGYSLTDLGEYQKALEEYLISVKLFQELGEENREAIAYNDIGYIFQSQGLIEKAIDSYIKSLKLLEKLDDKASIGSCLNNIGLLYHDQQNFEKALEYYQKGLKVKEESGDEKSLAVSYNNLGSLFFSKQKYLEAKNYFFKSLALRKKFNDQPGIGQCLINIAAIYRELKEYDTSLEYLLMAEKIQIELDNKSGIINTQNSIGVIYRLKHDFKCANEYLVKSYNMAKKIGAPKLIANTALSLSYQNRDLKNYEKAYLLLVEHRKMTDSLENEENTRNTIQVGLQYEFEKKLHESEMAQMKKDHEHELEIKEQKMISYSFAGGILGLIILSLVILKSLNDKKKANVRITQQKIEIEEKSNKLEDALTNITDSVRYAKRIQQALLHNEEKVDESMPNHFILFKPKDIVSGDFYWSYKKDNLIYIAEADCTGHGVPGALMSMLGISFLNTINSEEPILSPAEILNKLREKVIKELGQTSKSYGSRDGMDISLLMIDKDTNTVQWAGANNNLIMIKDNDVKEIKSDRQAINFTESPQPFTNHKIEDIASTKFYLFTDGYADQFGGEKSKKLKYKAFKELLLSTSKESIENQKKAIDKFFNEWKGNLQQIDDVCVIGIEV